MDVRFEQHLLTWCLLFMPVYAAGQTAPQPVASDFREGERWAWQRVDELTNVATAKTFVRRIVRTDDGLVFLGKNKRYFTVDQIYGAAARKWPLEIGKTWTFQTDWTETQGSGTTVEKATVVSWESVTVPAGTFMAFKIEYKGSWNMKDYAGIGWGGEITDTYWYAPEVKADVKRQHVTYGRHGSEQWRNELIVYDPAAK